MSNSSDQKLQAYYTAAFNLIKKCGTLVYEGYTTKSKTNFQVKSDFHDFITVYDKQIEDLLIEGLKAEFPETVFIGEEESAASKRKAVLTDAPTWIIDPIDGTTNFIRQVPHCCISVGLAINKELVIGIVYNPIANEMYTALKGQGAYLNDKRIYASKKTKINDAVVANEISLIAAPEARDKKMKCLYKLASNANGTRSFGSAALTVCYVASGAIDVYHVEQMKPWDIAGGAAVLIEAGGVICDSNGGKYDIMHPNVICAATEDLAKNVLELIVEADQITEYTFN